MRLKEKSCRPNVLLINTDQLRYRQKIFDVFSEPNDPMVSNLWIGRFLCGGAVDKTRN